MFNRTLKAVEEEVKKEREKLDKEAKAQRASK